MFSTFYRPDCSALIHLNPVMVHPALALYNSRMELEVDEKLDACGLTCPLPLLKAKQALNKLDSGLVLEVVCTDPGSVRDFEVFASQSGNELLGQKESDGEYWHWLRKA